MRAFSRNLCGRCIPAVMLAASLGGWLLSDARAGCIDYRGQGIRLLEEGILPGAVARDIAGPYLYATQGNTIYILDVSGEEETVVSSLALARSVGSLEHDGSHLYATTTIYYEDPGTWGDLTLHIIDVSDPDTPSVVISLYMGYTYGGSCLTIADDFAYLGAFHQHPNLGGTVIIVDISYPADPKIVEHIYDIEARDIEVIGNRAYVAGYAGYYGNPDLQIYDVAQPSNARLLAAVDLPATALSLAVRGDFAYVGTWDWSVQVISISELTAPEIVGRLERHMAFSLEVLDSRLIGGGPGSGILFVADLTNPVAPAFIGGGPIGFGGGIVVADPFVYASNGISRYDISDPEVAPPVNVTDPGDVEDVIVQPPYAYVCEGDEFQIYNVSNASAPLLLGMVPTEGGTFGSAVRDGIAFVVDDLALRTIEVTDPGNPQVLAYLETGASPLLDVELMGDYAIVCDAAGLHVIEVANPSNPQVVGFLSLPGLAALERVGSIVYGVHGENGLRIIDVANPLSPSLVGTLAGNCYSVDVSGNLACVLWSSRLQIFDISTPALPVPRSAIDTYGWLVHLDGNIAYVTSLWVTKIVDLSNPDAPSMTSYMYVPAKNYGATDSDGEYLYLAAQEDGLFIMNLQCEVASADGVLPHGVTSGALICPNPFNESTTIRYEIPRATQVDLRIHDAAGRLIRSLSRGSIQPAGVHEVTWNGRDEAGRSVPAGTYFYRIGVGDHAQTGRMIRLVR